MQLKRPLKRPDQLDRSALRPLHPLTPTPSEAARDLANVLAAILADCPLYVRDNGLEQFRTALPIQPLTLTFRRWENAIQLVIADEHLGTQEVRPSSPEAGRV